MDEQIEPTNEVLSVVVRFDGQEHSANYFLEGGVVHAAFDGRMQTFPLGLGNAADIVRASLTAHLLETHREPSGTENWEVFPGEV